MTECIDRCTKLDYERYEIILLPDDDVEIQGVKVAPTGVVLPGKKRNIGARVATGDILAYIDSDAYPRGDWLRNAVSHLHGERVGAVGGPAVTAPEDGKLCKAEGLALSSFMMGASLSARYGGSATSEADDNHSVNFVAWRKTIDEVGGWDEHYWPGEDTLICRAIRKTGYKQLLATDVVVFHHRRPMLTQYVRQIGNFGVHRGFFAKRFPETSRRIGYFVPSMVLLALIFGLPISLLVPLFWPVYVSGVTLYFLLLIAAAALSREYRLFVFILIPLTHFIYGGGFIRGLLARRRPR